MEDKIEVNEYVRTDKGKIGKVVEIRLGFNKDLQEYQDIYKLDNGLWTILDYIVKHSKQLIDLIEVKDVIKYRIDNISTTLETKGYIEGIIDISDEEILQNIKHDKNYHIFEILTCQQFEANCYENREENNNVHRYIYNTNKKYNIIYADPPWNYGDVHKWHKMGRRSKRTL